MIRKSFRRRFVLPAALLAVLLEITISGSRDTERLSESWMGVYVDGIKIGYIANREERVLREEREFIRAVSESVMRVSRLGSDPIVIKTVQDSLFDAEDKPISTELRTLMSESETVIRAEIGPEFVVFTLAGETVKRIPIPGEFVLGIPYEKLNRDGDLKAGFRKLFRMLDPMTYGFSDCRFEVVGREWIVVLGERRRLWHVRSEVASLIPITVDEWIDESGRVHKSETQSGFLNTTALWMSREKAMEESEHNLDIAFSSIIPVDVRFDDPRRVRRMELELAGIPIDKLKGFPWDGGGQVVLREEMDRLRIETRSVLMREADAPELPIDAPELRFALEATPFCQADDPGIVKLAREIVGRERNVWRAAKLIAQWIARELTPNYDVGFATAVEILRNREGDCSEHTVLFVALCRAAGIPARAAVGIMSSDGLFAYHMWPEVWAGRWVSLDPLWMGLDRETGESYTDATHLMFGRSDLDEDMFQEMITAISEIIGKLTIKILDYDLE